MKKKLMVIWAAVLVGAIAYYALAGKAHLLAYVLFPALIVLHVVAFCAYLLGGSLDRALISLTPVFGALMFLKEMLKKEI